MKTAWYSFSGGIATTLTQLTKLTKLTKLTLAVGWEQRRNSVAPDRAAGTAARYVRA